MRYDYPWFDDHPLLLLVVIALLFAFVILILLLSHLLVQHAPMSPDWSEYMNMSYNLSEWLV